MDAGPATTGIRLTEAQRIAWLRLIRSENVGPATFRDLVSHFGSAAGALDALPALAARTGRRIRIATEAEAERELRALERLGARLVGIGEPDYPPWLREADGAPPLVSLRGGREGLTLLPTVAIVGARNASVAGRKIAMTIARGLGERGFLVVSGLARGIDAAAHEATLDTGTVAVAAGGLDRLYPPENLELADRILAAGGAHLSEMPLGWEPRARDFPRRNRIVSGMAAAVVVVEAAERSGSLITARLAGEQGRLVCAVPGSPLDPRAAGTNRLIKNGAHLVTEAGDVAELVAPQLSRPLGPPPQWREEDETGYPADEPAEDERALLLEALGPAPVTIDELIRFTGLSPATVQVLLLELDLSGRLARHPGQRVSLVDP